MLDGPLETASLPHHFTNRPRLHSLVADAADLQTNFRWEAVNAAIYNLGGLVFMIGSVLFFPRFSAYADIGAWVFIVGSGLYLVVTGHDMLEASRHWRTLGRPPLAERLSYWSAATYLAGTVLFTIGSVLFLSAIGQVTAGAACFIVGSLLFVVGATIDVLQIVQAQTLKTLQLINLTGVCFLVGSTLFAVASVPYLWSWQAPADSEKVLGFLALQYLIGSALFLAGGIFNYWRASIVVRDALAKASKGA